jgi:hypothetical protein
VKLCLTARLTYGSQKSQSEEAVRGGCVCLCLRSVAGTQGETAYATLSELRPVHTETTRDHQIVTYPTCMQR